MKNVYLLSEKNIKGFTLLEMLLYVTLASAVLLTITIFLNLSLVSKAKSQTIIEVDQQGNFAMRKILKTIRQSRGVNSPISGSSASTISLQYLQPADNPTTFALLNDILQITKGASGSIDLTTDKVKVSSLTFANVARTGTNDNIKVSFTVNYNNPSGRNEFSYTQNFNGSANVR